MEAEEGGDASQYVPGTDSQGVDIRATADSRFPEYLRCLVRYRASEESFVVSAGQQLNNLSSSLHLLPPSDHGAAEIGQFEAPARLDEEDVRWLHVEVQNGGGVAVGEGRCDLMNGIHLQLALHYTVLVVQQRLQTAPVHQLTHHVEAAVGHCESQCRHDEGRGRNEKGQQLATEQPLLRASRATHLLESYGSIVV